MMKPKYIKIVDDEPDILAVLTEQILSEFPDCEIKVSDAFGNLDSSPDILIVDYLMRGITGLQFVKKNLDHFKSSKIVFFTAFVESIDADMRELRDLGLDVRTVQKPEYKRLINELHVLTNPNSLITMCKDCGTKIIWISKIDQSVELCEECFDILNSRKKLLGFKR